MEILRSIFDHCCEDGYSSCGIVVAGEPGLEAQIETHLDRYANRTIFRTKLGGLSEAEVEEYLSDRTVEPEALELVVVPCAAGNERGEVFGGHLNSAVVSATCELVLQVIDGQVERVFDPEIGLNLFQFL